MLEVRFHHLSWLVSGYEADVVRFDGYREYPILAGEALFDQSRESEAVGQYSNIQQ